MTFGAADFVTTEIHERQIVLADGQPHAIYFRELPNTDLKRYALWQLSDDEDVRVAAEARLLSVGVCEPDGTQMLTVEQAIKLRLPIMRRLCIALLEINQYYDKVGDGTEEGTEPGKD